jgi:hypothetical protein
VLLLGGDLLLRDAVLADEVSDADGGVLSREQLAGEAPLPEELRTSGGSSNAASETDRLWDAYFRHAAAVAARTGNELLRAWVGFEVALRNALAERRAKALELDPEPYRVATELAGRDVDVESILNAWAAAGNPMAALQVLDRARWAWLDAHQRTYSFRDEELAAYALRLGLLARWDRLSRGPADADTAPAGDERDAT